MNRPNFNNPYDFGSPFGGPARGGYTPRGSPRHGNGGGGFRTPSPHHHPHPNMPPPQRPFSPQYGGPPLPPSPDFSPRGMRTPYRQNFPPRTPFSGGGNRGGWSPNRNSYKGGRGRGGFSPSHGNQHFKHRDRNPGGSDNIEDYYKDSMLADPWAGMVPVPVTRPLDFTT